MDHQNHDQIVRDLWNPTDRFVPIWQPEQYYDDEETIRTTSSNVEVTSCLTHLGKRQRPMATVMSEYEDRARKRRAQRNEVFLTYHTEWLITGGRNPQFIPKYLCDRIPLPMNLMQDIYRNYLAPIDRAVLTGDSKIVTNLSYLGIKWPKDIVFIAQPQPGLFQFIEHNIFECDPNNP